MHWGPKKKDWEEQLKLEIAFIVFFCLVCTSSFFVYGCEKSKLCRGLDCSNALVIKAVQFNNSLHSLCQAYIEYCNTCQCFILNSITLLANIRSMCKTFQMYEIINQQRWPSMEKRSLKVFLERKNHGNNQLTNCRTMIHERSLKCPW